MCRDPTYAQAGLSLCWSHLPHSWKSHVAAQVFKAFGKVIEHIDNISQIKIDKADTNLKSSTTNM